MKEAILGTERLLMSSRLDRLVYWKSSLKLASW